MKLCVIGSLLILSVVVAWIFVAPQLLPYIPFIPQTVYYHSIDGLHAFRVYTEYNVEWGDVISCVALRGNEPICTPKSLGPRYRWRGELTFQTVVTEDAMAALVPQEHPFYIFLLVDLKTLENSRRGWSEASEAYLRRNPRLLKRFRASTKEPRYELVGID